MDPRQHGVCDGIEHARGVPEDVAIAFRVLCNAAKADKERLHRLEVEVARLSHKADTVEDENGALQERLQELQAALAHKERELEEEIAQRVQQNEQEVARLQERLKQKSLELLVQQHELAGAKHEHQQQLTELQQQHHQQLSSIHHAHKQELTEAEQQQQRELANAQRAYEHELSAAQQQHQNELAKLQQQHQQEMMRLQQQHQQELSRLQQQYEQELRALQQQLEDAATQAKQAEVSSAAIREALTVHSKMGQQLSSLLSRSNTPEPQSPAISTPPSPLPAHNALSLPLTSWPANPLASLPTALSLGAGRSGSAQAHAMDSVLRHIVDRPGGSITPTGPHAASPREATYGSGRSISCSYGASGARQAEADGRRQSPQGRGGSSAHVGPAQLAAEGGGGCSTARQGTDTAAATPRSSISSSRPSAKPLRPCHDSIMSIPSSFTTDRAVRRSEAGDREEHNPLNSGSSMIPFCPGQYAPNARGLAQKPRRCDSNADEQMRPQLLSGGALLPLSKPGRSHGSPSAAAAGSAKAGSSAAPVYRIASGKPAKATRQQLQQQQEEAQQRLQGVSQFAEDWLQQQAGKGAAPSASPRRAPKPEASSNTSRQAQYQQLLLRKAAIQLQLHEQQQQEEDEELRQQQEQERGRKMRQQQQKVQQKQKTKERGPGMLMFRWSRRFSGNGAPVEGPAAPESNRHGSRLSKAVAASRVFSPQSSCRVSNASSGTCRGGDSMGGASSGGGARPVGRSRAGAVAAGRQSSYADFYALSKLSTGVHQQ